MKTMKTWIVRGAVAATVTAAFSMVGIPTALAGTGSVSGAGILTYSAGGNDNIVQIVPTGTPAQFDLIETGEGVTAGAGCTDIGGTLRCSGVTGFVLNVGGGNDSVDLTAVSLAATVNLGSGSDTANSGAGNDTINGSTGDDSITAGAGNDVVNAGPDLDSVWGGAGDDTLNGGNDDDTIRGDAGNDALNGGDDLGSDHLLGGAGVDEATYAARVDRVTVSIDGAFNDGETLLGENDNVETDVENVVGGAGNDALVGSDLGANTLTGGDGNDSLEGLAGPDSLNGGAGEDFLSGAAGADSLDGGDGNDVLDGGAGPDSILAGLGADEVNGGSENDTIDGGAGDDSLLGGAGDDRITDLSGTNTLDGGDDDDTLTGGTGAESFFGRAGSDEITAGAGADSLKGGAGSDVLSGGDDDDVLDGGPDGDVMNGGAGIDLANYATRVASVTVTLDDLVGDGEVGENDNVGSDIEKVDAGWGNDTIVGSPFDNVLTDGPAGNDTLIGGEGNDLLRATTGNDVLSGEGGNDTMFGGSGNDTFGGGTGTDLVSYNDHVAGVSASIDGIANDGSAGEADNVSTDVENMIGSPSSDTLAGSAAANVLTGDPGSDTLLGGLGADTLNGGTGSDTASYLDHTTNVTADLDGLADDGAVGEGDLIATDIENLTGGLGNDALTGSPGANVFAGGAGLDTVSYADHVADVSASIDDLANDGASGEGDNISSDVENLIGGSGNDVLSGNSSANVFLGGLGSDTFNGLAGVDEVSYADHTGAVTVDADGVADDGTAALGEADNVGTDIENLTGGPSSDTLIGNASSNVLVGAGGADSLVGLAGVDTASYAEKTASVTVTIDGRVNDGTLGEGDNVAIDVENLIGGSAADVLTGSSAANTITGGLGADKMNGGKGNDVFYALDKAVDTLNGSTGIDSAKVDKKDVRISIEKLFR